MATANGLSLRQVDITKSKMGLKNSVTILQGNGKTKSDKTRECSQYRRYYESFQHVGLAHGVATTF